MKEIDLFAVRAELRKLVNKDLRVIYYFVDNPVIEIKGTYHLFYDDLKKVINYCQRHSLDCYITTTTNNLPVICVGKK